MEEHTFWLRVWQTVAAALVAITLSITGCTSYRTAAIESMVKGGADPIRASCAIKGVDGTGDVAICLVAAGK